MYVLISFIRLLLFFYFFLRINFLCLDMSLLERLMEKHSIYGKTVKVDGKPDQYNDAVLTKLVKNYRSHRVILQLSNKHFYDGELVEAAPEIRKMMCEWEGLPQKDFPLIFHAIIGEDMREERSPSFFNPEEVSIVVRYVKQLMDSQIQGRKLKQNEIGVISPYRKQVHDIQLLILCCCLFLLLCL